MDLTEEVFIQKDKMLPGLIYANTSITTVEFALGL